MNNRKDPFLRNCLDEKMQGVILQETRPEEYFIKERDHLSEKVRQTPPAFWHREAFCGVLLLK